MKKNFCIKKKKPYFFSQLIVPSLSHMIILKKKKFFNYHSSLEDTLYGKFDTFLCTIVLLKRKDNFYSWKVETIVVLLKGEA